MAVKNQLKKPMKAPGVVDFWPRYRKSVITSVILIQGAIGLVATFLLIGIFRIPLESAWMIAAIVFFIALLITATATLLLWLLKPFDDTLAAITKVSGEPNNLIPPNPNDPVYEKIGLAPVLQQIYRMAATHDTCAPAKDQDELDRQALDQTPNGIVFLDAKRRIIYANKNAPIKEGSEGEPLLSLVFDDISLDTWLDEVRDSLRATRTWNRIPSALADQEDRRIFDISASYEKGSSAEVVLVMFDRTDLYVPQDEDLNFISFAAHELRGPITVIRGYLDTFQDELGAIMQPDTKELLKRIDVSASRLSGYVNNILNTAKYDRRHLKIHLAEESVADIYNTIRDDMELRAASQGRLLTVDFPQDLPTIAADRASISEVLSNYIDNAIKYSHEGGSVVVKAKQDGDFVVVSVQDFGIGIPPNLIGNLFHKFYRSHRSRELIGGTGIGLYISKAMIESHGGSVGVSSTEGEGSTFTFSLPIYATVAETIKNSDNTNESLIVTRDGWIRNHTMYKG